MFNYSSNDVILNGRLGNDPDIKFLQSGEAVANFSIATSEKWKDKNSGERKERTEWVKCVLYGKRAEIMGEYFHKGDLIHFKGSLRTRKWTDRDGNDRYNTEVVATQWTGDLQLLHSKGGSNPAAREDVGAPHDDAVNTATPVPASDLDYDDIPF